MTDSEVWDKAKERELVIVTKDSDFTDRIIYSNPPPKVVQFKLGNIRSKDFYQYLELNWANIIELIESHKLVIASATKITAI